MAVMRIITDSDTTPLKDKLYQACAETTVEQARPVIQDLMDTAHYHKNCAGLAANQIGSNLRVFVIKVRGKFKAFINPKFNPAGKRVKGIERCLSFPGKFSTVERYNIITAVPYRKRRAITLSGSEAIAFQHELDHLNGITILEG